MTTALSHYVAEAEAALAKRPHLQGTSHDALLALREYVNHLDEAIRGIVAAYDAEQPELVEWSVTTDEDGDHHTECPHCGSVDSISEVDTAVRWNTLSLTGEATAVASTGDGDFEGDGWVCTSCDSLALSSPEGFEITSWD